jgi:hypothetical protein
MVGTIGADVWPATSTAVYTGKGRLWVAFIAQ